MSWFITLIFYLATMLAVYGSVDAYMFRQVTDYDGKGIDYPKWLRKYIHIFWLIGLASWIMGICVFTLFSPSSGFKTLLTISLSTLAMSFVWDMAFSWLKSRTFTRSLKYWFYIPGVTIIGWHSKKAVITSYIIRALILVPVYIYLVK